MLLLGFLFSLRARCTECLVCCACAAYKEARGKSHSTSYYIFTLKKCSGVSFSPQRDSSPPNMYLLYCCSGVWIDNSSPDKEGDSSFFILLRGSQPLLSSCRCPLYRISCMSVPVVVSTSPLQLAPCVTLWDWIMVQCWELFSAQT